MKTSTASTFVDVTGTSKGKGFQGVMKRHNFQGGPAAHGSKFHRTPGSVGQATYPGRIFKQKKMPGQMGNKTKTVQNLQVVELNEEQGYMLIKGSIPGAKNGFVRIAKAIKKA
jgi:large subunit ribosomal protein L3